MKYLFKSSHLKSQMHWFENRMCWNQCDGTPWQSHFKAWYSSGVSERKSKEQQPCLFAAQFQDSPRLQSKAAAWHRDSFPCPHKCKDSLVSCPIWNVSKSYVKQLRLITGFKASKFVADTRTQLLWSLLLSFAASSVMYLKFCKEETGFTANSLSSWKARRVSEGPV